MGERTVISIGNFDGVHVGHRAILRRAREIATDRRARLIGITFDPHPATVLRSGSEPLRLVSREDKVQMLYAAGADQVVVLEPHPSFLSKTAEEFVDWLTSQYAPLVVVEGPDFRFGKDRTGDVALLRQLGQQKDFEVVQIGQVEAALSDLLMVSVSSSLVRWLLAHGRVADAATCLGRAYHVVGRVVRGEQRGRALGFPTANLDAQDLAGYAVPGQGVYAGHVNCPNGVWHPAAISVGVKPTFGKQEQIVEMHLLDYDGELYGQKLTVRFSRWLRDQCAFPGPGQLKAQLDRDLVQVRQLVAYQMFDVSAPRVLLDSMGVA